MATYLKKRYTVKTTKIDNSTGEIIYDEQKEYYSPFDDRGYYNFKYSASKSKVYKNIEIDKRLNYSDIGKLFYLSRISSSRNRLEREVEGRYYKYSLDYISEVLEINKTNLGIFLKKMRNCNVIKRDLNGVMCINPKYFNSMKYMDFDIYILFEEELKKHVPEKFKKEVENYVRYSRHNTNRDEKEGDNEQVTTV